MEQRQPGGLAEQLLEKAIDHAGLELEPDQRGGRLDRLAAARRRSAG